MPRTERLPEIYMRVIDPKRILKLMAIQDVSARQLAAGVGYSSHTYIQRILRGEISTVTPERAARISRYLGCGVDDLFLPKLSTDARQSVQRKRAS